MEPLIVAVQGELGSNSHVAARACFAPETPCILSCRSFAELFADLAEGRASYAMAPVDNSLTGGIHEVWDLLTDGRWAICAELYLRIRHCLIASHGVGLNCVERILSHPQALAQCSHFLTSLNGVTEVEEYDTAGAVELIASGNRDGDAAIAPAEAATIHNMQIVAEDIQDRHDNFTRFLVVATGAEQTFGDNPRKSTLVIHLDGGARRLSTILAELGKVCLEISRIESRKLAEPWEYLYYIDVEREVDESVRQLLASHARTVHVVGPYPSGNRVEPESVRAPT